jgi:hypothetical protein
MRTVNVTIEVTDDLKRSTLRTLLDLAFEDVDEVVAFHVEEGVRSEETATT